jgi:DNA-binding protein H-NS
MNMFRKKEPPKDPIEVLPYDELLALKLKVEREIANRGTAELDALKEKLLTIAAAHGVSIGKLFAAPKSRRSRLSARAARYRNPDNPDETWSGLGKPKKWLQEKLDQGRALEEFAV